MKNVQSCKMKQFSTSVNQENDGAAVKVTRGPLKLSFWNLQWLFLLDGRALWSMLTNRESELNMS